MPISDPAEVNDALLIRPSFQYFVNSCSMLDNKSELPSTLQPVKEWNFFSRIAFNFHSSGSSGILDANVIVSKVVVGYCGGIYVMQEIATKCMKSYSVIAPIGIIGESSSESHLEYH